LTLLPRSLIIGVLGRTSTRYRSDSEHLQKGNKMAKAPKAIDFSNKALSAELGKTVDEVALREWFDKSASMIINKELSCRGWSATVAESGSSAMIETYSAYVVRAYLAGHLKGAEKVHAKELITVTQAISRDVKAGEFKKFLSEKKTWKEYKDAVKPKAKRGAGATSAEKELSADEIVEKALNAFRESETHFISNLEDAKMLISIIQLAIKNSNPVELEASVKAHPAKGVTLKA